MTTAGTDNATAAVQALLDDLEQVLELDDRDRAHWSARVLEYHPRVAADQLSDQGLEVQEVARATLWALAGGEALRSTTVDRWIAAVIEAPTPRTSPSSRASHLAPAPPAAPVPVPESPTPPQPTPFPSPLPSARTSILSPDRVPAPAVGAGVTAVVAPVPAAPPPTPDPPDGDIRSPADRHLTFAPPPSSRSRSSRRSLWLGVGVAGLITGWVAFAAVDAAIGDDDTAAVASDTSPAMTGLPTATPSATSPNTASPNTASSSTTGPSTTAPATNPPSTASSNTAAPAATAAPTPTESVAVQPLMGNGCSPNYEPCVPADSDVDCAGGSGNGPSYVTGPVRVVGTDVYDLDRDGDGIGC
ncbi:MAG: hypothetical protein ACK5RL_05840 [Acidimicrobiales bacterium]